MTTAAPRLLQRRRGVERVARAGLAGKGLLYVVVGLLAGRVALHGGAGGHEASQTGAIQAVAEGPFGAALLAVLALGLSGYALWRLAQVGIGPVDGSDLPGPVVRLTFLVRGVGYGAIAVLAWRTLLVGGGGDGGGEQRWTRQLLELPFGVPLVVAIGVVFVGVGLYQVKAGVGRGFMDATDTGSMSRSGRTWFERTGVAGHLARAVVYVLVGLFLAHAALTFDTDRVGLDAALSELAGAPFGTAMLVMVAVGLVLYGLFCFAMSRHARVRDVT